MSKRIRNFRAGDRAEDLGILLLKAFCAVAPIPRQEDFGLADAVATLLRSEGKFWYAEDSFLVQFKSRTEKEVELKGPLFDRWLTEDLSVIVARVNLHQNTIELFSLGTLLFDRRIHDANGLVVWLTDCEEGLRDGVLHVELKKPILKWSVGDTENSDFTDESYRILKHWLGLERWNRRYFRAGVAREIIWETSRMPEVGDAVHTWTPARGQIALAEIEPLADLLGLHCKHHPELWARVHAVEDALRGRENPSTFPGLGPYQRMFEAMSRLSDLIKGHPTADAVVIVQLLRVDEHGANFWINSYGRGESGAGHRHEGTWEELRLKGFDFNIERDGPNAKFTINFARYFASQLIPHEIIDAPNETPVVGLGEYSPCYFLRRLPLNKPDLPAQV